MQLNLETMPFGNGAGSVKRIDDVEKACRGPMTRVTVGSITAQPRAGNLGETYYFQPRRRWSLNSLGLPNLGIVAYVNQILPEMVQMAHGAGKKIWASISPFSSEECGQMAEQCFEAGVDGVEINGSCPNVWKGTERKAIPALDPEAAADMFLVLGRYVGDMGNISFKLSPTNDRDILQQLAKVFKQYRVMQLVCCNAKADQEGMRLDGTPALAFRTSDEDPVVKYKGGLGGTEVHTDNMIVTLRMHILMPEVEIIGVGGIFCADDVIDFVSAGAIGFQATTAYLEHGERLFVDILTELAEKYPV